MPAEQSLSRSDRIKDRKPTVIYLIDWYDAWLRLEDASDVANALNVTTATVHNHLDKYADLKYAKEQADKRRGARTVFSRYILDSLSAEARETWAKMQFWENSTSSFERVESILSGKTKRVRQEIFLHAVISTGFDLSAACRMSGVSYDMLQGWRETDMDFRRMVEEIQFHKKNFFERALIGLVEQGHPAATIHANETVNADRGYSKKLTITNNDGAGRFSIDDLDLDIDTRRKVLEAIRKRALRQENVDVEAIKVVKALPEKVTTSRR
jgi:hypothetical protein